MAIERDIELFISLGLVTDARDVARTNSRQPN
jgi:hypothetical protein